MRIYTNNNIASMFQAQRPKAGAKTQKSPLASSYGRDEVQISSFGKDIQTAKQAVAEASDIREDKVAEMKQKYSGDYQVDTGDFASVLLAKYSAANASL